MRVKIEDMHIRCGVPNSGGFCPVAQALEPMLPVGHKPVVGRGFVAIWDGDPTKKAQLLGTYDLPDEATTFVRRYDAGEKVEPFEFDLDLS